MSKNIPPCPPPPVFTSPSDNYKTLLIDNESELTNLIRTESSRISGQHVPIVKTFRPVQPVIQDGPTCGMVALVMGASDKNISVVNLIKIAQKQGWSNMGEMYSCEWMTELANMMGVSARWIRNGIQNHLECITDCIRRGGSLLVPYDKDKNHAPGLMNGVSAHWALVTGIVCLDAPTYIEQWDVAISPCRCIDRSNTICSENLWALAGTNPTVYLEANADQLKLHSNPSISCSNLVVPFVCAYQGLSRHIQLWPFLSLAVSNANLQAVGPARSEQVVLPPGGVAKGLAGQAVLLEPSG